jgi:2-oxoisovalerate dehydrogenase E1 component beta subunit
MALKTFIEAIRDTLFEEMRRDEAVIVLGEDVGKKGGVFLATDGLWGEFGDDRVIDTPLSESLIVGASIGAAMNGLRRWPRSSSPTSSSRPSTSSCPRRRGCATAPTTASACR